MKKILSFNKQGSVCGTVGTAITSDTRDPQVQTLSSEKFYVPIYLQIYYRKEGNKEKETWNNPPLKQF